MAILVGRESRVIVQGITGYNGRNTAGRMLESGTRLVGGVTPGRGGQQVHGLPVYDSCAEAVARLGANASFVSVPAPFVLDACREAIEAGIELLCVYTEGVAVADSIRIVAHARRHGATVLGPNSAGCVSPGLANVSDLNDAYIPTGRVGIVSKSGTLTYEAIDSLAREGLGISTVVCLGGDPVTGTGHREVLERFDADPETDAMVLLGEIGGRSELDAAEIIGALGKPVVAVIVGRAAPPGKRMGHAGAMLGADDENAPGKTAALAAAGAVIAGGITTVGRAVRRALDGARD